LSKLHAIVWKQKLQKAWASAETFPGGGKVDISLILLRLLTVQRKCSYTKRFTFSTPQRKWSMLRQQLH